MKQTIISVIIFFVVLIVATLLWDLYNSSKESNLINLNTQATALMAFFERDIFISQEWSLDSNLQLVGVEVDGNSDVLVELAIKAIEVPENLRIIV